MIRCCAACVPEAYCGRPGFARPSTMRSKWLAIISSSTASPGSVIGACQWLCGFLNRPMAPAKRCASASRSASGSIMSVSGPVFSLNAARVSFVPTRSGGSPAAARTATSTSLNAWNTAVS